MSKEIFIYPNKYNNFVYPDTNLIIRNNKVVAKEGQDGIWLPLSPKDIKDAKKLKLRHEIIDLQFKGDLGPS
jgi:hypothetical protein